MLATLPSCKELGVCVCVFTLIKFFVSLSSASLSLFLLFILLVLMVRQSALTSSPFSANVDITKTRFDDDARSRASYFCQVYG